ncbi:MAG: hypothetical protein E7480_03765 [Ruminococcaceae bacterium]|nr:hypothetical protein [Oscillospiraceae bacterium]
MKSKSAGVKINNRIWLLVLILSAIVFVALAVFSVNYLGNVTGQIKTVTEENNKNTVTLNDYTTKINNENLKYLETIMNSAFSENQLTEIAKRNYSYVFTVNGKVVQNEDVVYVSGSTVSIGLVETIKDSGLPKNILNLGRVKDFTGSFEDFSNSVRITCGKKEYKKTISSKNLATNAYFTYTDIQKGDIITVFFSDDLSGRVEFGQNFFEIIYN